MYDFNYMELLPRLGIAPGSMLMVSADLTRIAILARRRQERFNIHLFIDSLQNHLGTEGTLIIPAFNFNLKNKDHFHPSRTLPVTGALAVEALKREDFRRTTHPLHSFLVWGKEAGELLALDNLSSFGKDSPFAFMHEKLAKMLLVDTTVSAAFTFVHHVEEMERVKYRRYRRMLISVEGEEGTGRREVLLYAKKAGWTMQLEGLEKKLMEEKAAVMTYFDKLACTVVDLRAAYPVIQKDIRSNNAKSLARFSFDLYLREKAKTVLAIFGIQTLSDRISHDPGLL